MGKLKNKNVLVTGASGFIGRNLVNALLEEKAIVYVLLRKKKEKNLFKNKKIKVCFADLTDAKSLNKIPSKIDIVFNLAGGLPYHNLNDDAYFKINSQGVKNLMSSLQKKKIKRIIHVSTVGVYGEPARNVTEKSKFNPQGPYAISKLEGEKKIKEYSKKGIVYTIIRPTIAYGPYDNKRPVVLSLIKMLQKKMFVIPSDGRNKFHTVYVDNLIQGLILAATNKKAENEDFIIGDQEIPTFKELVNSIKLALNDNFPTLSIPKQVAYIILGPFIKEKLNFITQEKSYKIDKAKKYLGYNPKINIVEGIRLTVEWYRREKVIKS